MGGHRRNDRRDFEGITAGRQGVSVRTSTITTVKIQEPNGDHGFTKKLHTEKRNRHTAEKDSAPRQGMGVPFKLSQRYTGESPG